MSTKKGLLIIIAVILVGILGVVIVDANQKSPGEQIADDIGKFTEEIGDEVDDNT